MGSWRIACVTAVAALTWIGCATGGRRPVGGTDAGSPGLDSGPGEDDGGGSDASSPSDAGRTDGGGGTDASGTPCEGVDCSHLDAECQAGECDPTDGTCMATPVTDGTACDDGDACTTGDACASGICSGTALDCSAMTDMCNAGSCDATTGTCTATPMADGTACDDGDACTSADACSSGTCVGTAVDCSAMTDMCNVGSCDATTGACTATPVADGTTCDDGDACTSGDVCTSGTCAGTGSCGSGTLMPGRTDLVATRDGWSVRCLAWSGRTCTHGQAQMECSVCPTYTQCGVWHDITTFNDGGNRCSVNFCALATGDATINSTGTGAATATAPRGCGWGSSSHPHCEAGRATYHVPVSGVSSSYGLLLNESYCSNHITLRTFDCGGW